jgi:hypothetical protein
MVRELWIGVATRAPPPLVGLSSQYSLGLFGCRKDGSGLLDLVASHEAAAAPANSGSSDTALVLPPVGECGRVRHGDLPIRRWKAKIHAPNTAGSRLQAASAGAERRGGNCRGATATRHPTNRQQVALFGLSQDTAYRAWGHATLSFRNTRTASDLHHPEHSL